MKKIVLCSIVYSIAILLAGCSRVENNPNGETVVSPWNPDEISGHIEKQLDDSIYVDADVHVPAKRPEYWYNARNKMPDEKELQQIFFEEGEAVTTEAYPEMENWRCSSVDGEKRASWADAVVFHRINYISYYGLFTSCADYYEMFPENLYRLSSFEPAEKLSFMAPENAKEIVRETAKKMNVGLEEEPYVFFALDETALKTLYNELTADWPEENIEIYLPNVEFEDDKGCYYMIWREQCPHGETIMSGNYSTNYGSGVKYTMGVYLMAIVNEEGLVTLFSNIRYAYDGENEIDKPLIDVDTALEQIRAMYENVILPEEIYITDISLQYVSIMEDFDKRSYKIVPAWCMKTEAESFRMYVVDAITGDIL